MALNFLTDIVSLLCGGGAGALIMQFYTARVNKQKLAAEAEKESADAERKKQDNQQDAFDTMYQQLNKCMADYAEISDNYRAYREKARKHEEEIQDLIQSKCLELATLKSKLAYFKGIRCYDTLCARRIKVDPDKQPVQQTETLSKEAIQTETPQTNN